MVMSKYNTIIFCIFTYIFIFGLSYFVSLIIGSRWDDKVPIYYLFRSLKVPVPLPISLPVHKLQWNEKSALRKRILLSVLRKYVCRNLLRSKVSYMFGWIYSYSIECNGTVQYRKNKWKILYFHLAWKKSLRWLAYIYTIVWKVNLVKLSNSTKMVVNVSKNEQVHFTPIFLSFTRVFFLYKQYG